jgi:hypothetical protein
LRTFTVSDVEPPLQNFDMSATASPDGVTPSIRGPGQRFLRGSAPTATA